MIIFVVFFVLSEIALLYSFEAVIRAYYFQFRD